MAKFIEDIHNLYNILAGKNVATKQPPERIDQVLYEVTIGIFNDNYKHYVKTQEISDFLLPFKRVDTLTLSSGKKDIPTDYAHHRMTTLPNGVEIPMVEDKFWSKRAYRKLSPPTTAAPICRIENTNADPSVSQIEVFPVVPSVLFYYFKKPTKAKYAYDKEGTRYIYNDTDSVDSDFGVLLFPQIAMKVLSRFGINLREQQVIQYAEAMKAQESTK